MIKNPPVSTGDTGPIPGSGRSPEEGNGNPLRHSCLGNVMDRGAFVGYSPWDCRRVRHDFSSVQFSRSVVSDSPWTAAHQASLSITNSCSLCKLMSIKSVTKSNHLILCRPLLLLPSILASIRVFSNESVLRIRWPKLEHQSFQ